MHVWGIVTARVKFFFTPPRFEDPDKTRQASLLYIIVLTLFATNTLQIILFIFANPALGLESNLIVEVIDFVFLVLIRRGFVRTISFAVCMFIWVIIVVVARSNSGLFNPILGGLFIVNFLAGLLINEYAILVFAAISTASVVYLGELATQGFLPRFSAAVSLEQATSNYINGCIVTAVVGFLALRSTNQAIRDARRHQVALQDSNRRLEDDIIERTRVEQALKESEGRFRQMAENVNEVFWLVDVATSKYLYVSPSYEVVWGRPVEELYNGSSRSFAETVHPEDHDKLLRSMAQLNEGDYEGEYRIVRPDGSIRWVRAKFTAVKNEQGEVYRLAGISEDITARKEAETSLLETQRLRVALDAEHELSEIRNRLMRTISHEFRTPLTIIQTSSQMLEDYYDRMDLEQRQKRFRFIASQIKRLVELLEDISLVVQGITNHLNFKPERLNLELLCRLLVEEMQTAVGEERQLVFTSDGLINDMAADARLLDRALGNLLGNALKYSESPSQVTLKMTKEGEEAVLRIHDEGIGIPPEDQARIFEPFYRASNVNQVNGTGLGLRIVKDCITAHGGSVSFESAAGQGTTFIVRLPLRQVEAAMA
jgi:PAS domain S-box-containing protein